MVQWSSLISFKKGSFRYLIATDVAARGIDVEEIKLIINYDLPLDGESYVHRIGRAGCLVNTGKAISFVTQYENKFYVQSSIIPVKKSY